MLAFENVSCSLSERVVLRSIDLAVNEGETLVLLGRSGSGKTTLLKTVNRLIEPDGGTVRFEGRPVAELDRIALRRRIGYVIQESGLLPHLTVGRNVGLVPELENWPKARIEQRASELLETMGLPPSIYAGRYPRQLSGGERQRVGIARALAADPPLLLLDEPFAALDPVTRYELQQQFLELRRRFRKTAVFVTHDVREALLMASRIALLKDGVLEVVASPEEFCRSTTPDAAAFLRTLEQDGRLT